jgi:uncharacterized repeat protein (TIGR04138 family)
MTEKPGLSLEDIVDADGRYSVEAFEFVRDGLSYVVQKIHGDGHEVSEAEAQDRHVTGQQLSLGLRDYALMRYGPLAQAVLRHMGIQRSNDFGNIVYLMIDTGYMRKTEEDDLHDFDDVFEFAQAFAPPVRPSVTSPVVFQLSPPQSAGAGSA